jgi:hypothetical protein
VDADVSAPIMDRRADPVTHSPACVGWTLFGSGIAGSVDRRFACAGPAIAGTATALTRAVTLHARRRFGAPAPATVGAEKAGAALRIVKPPGVRDAERR